MNTYRSLVFAIFAVAAARGSARAEDTGQTIVRNAYATYIHDGTFTHKSVAALKPDLEAGLYAVLARWIAEPRHTNAIGEECSFDADPFFATQMGPGALPITLGSRITFERHAAVPVSIPLKSEGQHIPKVISHTLVELDGRGEHARIFDIVPVIDGKPYADASMRTMLVKFSKDPHCS